jgi:protein SCO1/2
MNRRDALKAGTGLAAAMLAAGVAPARAATAPRGALPGDSVYQLATPLVDQAGRKFVLGDSRGTPTIVSMFYTSCEFVCPMLIEAIRATQGKLSESERQRVNVLMVSFDPERDTVAVLQKTAKERGLDAHWTLARTDAASVRKFAAVLGVQYKPIANGDFNHTTALILLDADGRVVGKTTQLAGADPAFVKLVKGAVAAAA